MKRLLIICAAAIALGAWADSERIADFGTADISAGNTFWNVSGYNGGNVWREASASVSGFEARSYTRSASSGIKICTFQPGFIILFH